VTQAQVQLPDEIPVELPARASPATAHQHHAHHVHRRSARSLLGASVPLRLAIVAALAALLWVAIAWALA
jgi:hypothetical protein